MNAWLVLISVHMFDVYSTTEVHQYSYVYWIETLRWTWSKRIVKFSAILSHRFICLTIDRSCDELINLHHIQNCNWCISLWHIYCADANEMYSFLSTRISDSFSMRCVVKSDAHIYVDIHSYEITRRTRLHCHLFTCFLLFDCMKITLLHKINKINEIVLCSWKIHHRRNNFSIE
jgi:hypothetical protein